MGLIGTLSMSAAACGKQEEKTQVSTVSVEVAHPTSGELTNDTTYIGTVEPQQQVMVLPKMSGTVTDVRFQVGDQVKEGDVLFKIDDEAAQLQMASANATYSQAQAGVTVSQSSSRDLQNYQTERTIQQLKDSLGENNETLDDLEDNLGDVRDMIKKLGTQKEQQEANVKSAQAAFDAKKYLCIEKENAIKAAEDQGQDTTALKAALLDLEKDRDEAEGNLKKEQASLNAISAQISTLEGTKTNLKTNISSIENGQDTIRDNLTTAEQSYILTQTEVYPETDAMYATQLQAASVAVDSAKMQLDYCTVKTPISGLVEQVNVEKEGMAAAGSVAFIISNKDSMTVSFQVTEQAKNVLKEGDTIKAERNGVTYEGTITEIGTMAGAQTGLFTVKASLPGAGSSLPNGVSVKVYATTDRAEGSTVVPFDSLYFSGGDAYVYCVEDQKLVRTSVTVGLMDDEHAIISEGLDADSLVVSNWSSKLRNGADAVIVSVDGEAVNSTPDEEAAEE